MNKLINRSKLALALLLATSGCSTWNNKTPSTGNKMWPPTEWFKKEYQKPNSMAAIWSPDVLAMPGKLPTRGFGGRVYFYNELSQAIPVDGEIIVHGYLTTPGVQVEAEKVTADKTFAFTAAQLKTHFSPSELGASYSIWIPWDAAEGLRQEVTLIPTFKSVDGHLVQGEPARLYLPGRKAGKDDLPSPRAQTVSYRSSSTPTNPGIELPRVSQSVRTTTINVPSSSVLSRPSPMTRNVRSYTLKSPNQTGPSADMTTTTPEQTAPKATELPKPNPPAPLSGSEQPQKANASTMLEAAPNWHPHKLKPMRAQSQHWFDKDQ